MHLIEQKRAPECIVIHTGTCTSSEPSGWLSFTLEHTSFMKEVLYYIEIPWVWTMMHVEIKFKPKLNFIFYREITISRCMLYHMVVLLSDSKRCNINGCYPSHLAAICISRDSQSRNINGNITSFYCNTLYPWQKIYLFGFNCLSMIKVHSRFITKPLASSLLWTWRTQDISTYLLPYNGAYIDQ